LLRKYDIGFCILSAPELPTIFQVTSDFAYIRWHGTTQWYSYNYSRMELQKWAVLIKRIDVDDVFGYFNNDYHASAVNNCIKLKSLI
jgi:uncharacterized protein YecE (DUF72 family)